MFKKRYILLVTIVLVMLYIFPIPVSGKKDFILEGPITAIGDKNIKIRETWFNLKDNIKIIRNGMESTLKACEPSEQRIYQWAEAVIDKQKNICRLKVEYYVLEGIILDIQQEKIKIKIFKNHSIEQEIGTFNIFDEALKGLDDLREGEHLIALSTGNRIYKLINF